MALIKCSECGKEISDKAIKCVHCGYAINSTNREKTYKKEKRALFDKWFIILFVITLFLCLMSCYFILYLWKTMPALILGVLCILMYLLMLFKMKKAKIQIILSIILGIFLIICICVSINEVFRILHYIQYGLYEEHLKIIYSQ